MTQPIFDPNSLDPEFAEQREAHVAATERAMVAAGQIVETKPEFEDYYSFSDRVKWYFPDGVHYIEFEPMTEGARRKYQTRTASVLTMNRASGDSKIGLNVARDREALLEVSVKDWYMHRRDGMGNWVEVRFDDKNYGFKAWTLIANPKFIESLERAIRKANPWMASEMSVEDIDTEIERLQELREEVRQAEMGKSDS